MKPTKSTAINNPIKNFFHNSNLIDSLFTLSIIIVMIIIISNPERYTSGTISGLKLFVFSVLPGLFPFMFLTKLITELGFIFKVTKKFDKFSYSVFGTPGISIYAFVMSILSGYPIGAKIIGDLYCKGLITQKDAKKLALFCTTSGPIFVIGSVGSIMFGNIKLGIILYISHVCSCVLLAIMSNLIFKRKNQQKNQPSTTLQVVQNNNKNIIADCLVETINSLFVVGAYITLFFLVSELLDSLKIFSLLLNIINPILKALNLNTSFSQGFLYGIVEVTRGCKSLSAFNHPSAIILTSGILSFSGLSIIMQSMMFLKQAKIKTHEFLFMKFMHACFSMLLTFLILMIV